MSFLPLAALSSSCGYRPMEWGLSNRQFGSGLPGLLARTSRGFLQRGHHARNEVIELLKRDSMPLDAVWLRQPLLGDVARRRNLALLYPFTFSGLLARYVFLQRTFKPWEARVGALGGARLG